MVKCNILAAIIPVLLVTGAANAAGVYNKDGNKADVYGKAVGLHYFPKHDGENAYATNGDQTYACLGSKGGAQINNQLTGYGQWEYRLSDNSPGDGSGAQNGSKTRLAFAGLKFDDAGSFDYGHDYDVVYGALGHADMLPEFGGDTAVPDQFFSQRNGGLVIYRSTNFFGLVKGLDFAVQHLGKNERDDVRRSSGGGVGSPISCELDGFGIVGTYGMADRTDVQQNLALRGHGDKAEQWATGVRYGANNIYPAANYSGACNATHISNGYANKTEDVLSVIQYQFDSGLRPSLAYIKSRGKDIEGIGDVDLVNCFEMDATYYFSRNMSIYVDYIISQIGSDNKLGVDSDDTATAGITYWLQ